LGYLFLSEEAPPAPFRSCGFDPTPDDLSCQYFAPCDPTVPQGTPVELVTPSSAARWLVPTDGSLGLSWTTPGFDDSGWREGEAAVGYDEEEEYLPHFTTDLDAWMNEGRTSVYLRVPFHVDEPLDVERLTLRVKYDDGFVAYLNGTRVASRNAPESLAWDSRSDGQHEDPLAVFFEAIDVTDAAEDLVVGDNVLALHGLNVSPTSSDFLLAVELEARVP
jgi:hypothetical protein